MLFEISVWPFFIKVADAPDEIVSCIANLCAGEKGDGGLNDCWEALIALFLEAVDMWV